VSVRGKNSTTLASRFGVTEDAFSEVGDTVAEKLMSDALALAIQNPWAQSPRDSLASRFGMALHPLFVKAFDSYIELLTKTILEHRRSNKPIEQESIVKQALQFCRDFEDSEKSSGWLTMAFAKTGAQFGQPEHHAFLTSLSLWTAGWDSEHYRFRNVTKRADRVIRRLVRLAPEVKPTARNAPSPTVELTERENKIYKVICRNSKGMQYCRELDAAAIKPRRGKSWQGCPGTYAGAYLVGDPWRHRIQDEKTKIRRKAELAKTRKPLASE
jgi:hypothetical protein